jgi:hypothetical protein
MGNMKQMLEQNLEQRAVPKARFRPPGRGPGLEQTLTRAAAILRATAEPRTSGQIMRVVSMPIAAFYRLANALVKMGWLKKVGHPTGLGYMFVRSEGQAFNFPTYPKLCVCGDVIRTIEHDKQHMTVRASEHMLVVTGA